MSNRPSTIWFTGFWGDFNPHNNYFRSLLPECKISPDNPDIVFYSVFGGPDDHKQYPKALKLHWSGEAREYNVNWQDELLLRIPLFYLYIDWFNIQSWGNPSYLVPLHKLFTPSPISSSKLLAANFIHNNITDKRRVALEQLKKVLPVHSFGSGMNNMGKVLGGNEEDKINLQSDYLFTLCFENGYRSGYITEKILHALVANTIPIYYGDDAVLNYFNPERIIYVRDGILRLEHVEKITKLLEDEDYRKHVLSLPIMTDIGMPSSDRSHILEAYEKYGSKKISNLVR